MFYLIKTPWWLRRLYGRCLWEMPRSEKVIYLSFDDGPHREATPIVLDALKRYSAKATFFCIGKNVKTEGDLYERIIDEGHAVGNHTFDHVNGWKTDDAAYLANIREARNYIDSALFRPPYGRISQLQLRLLTQSQPSYKVVMWTVLSGDFDTGLSKEDCLRNVLLNTEAGSIVVFHDSAKALERVAYTLPRMLEYFTEKGYRFEKLATEIVQE